MIEVELAIAPSGGAFGVAVTIEVGHSEAAGILTHRSDRLDQSGGYGEAFRAGLLRATHDLLL